MSHRLPVSPDRVLASTPGVEVEIVVAAGYESIAFLPKQYSPIPNSATVQASVSALPTVPRGIDHGPPPEVPTTGGVPIDYVMRDNDTIFTNQFDEVIESSGAEVKRNTPLSPNLRAHVERFIQTLKIECLDKFVIVGERHLNYIKREWSRHANRERPHEAREHLQPGIKQPPEAIETIRLKDVVCESRLCGLVNTYWRRAA